MIRKSWMKGCSVPFNKDGTMSLETQKAQNACGNHPATLTELRYAITHRVRHNAQHTDLSDYCEHVGVAHTYDITKPTMAADCLLALAWCQAWGKTMADYFSIPQGDQA